MNQNSSGIKKGAFTDAREDRIGRFELAQGGSLFLDELGNLPLYQQAKLLTAIQNRKITPVGSVKAVDVDIRLICATNENLIQAVNAGRFRQDLLFRINTIQIHLPPLRERKEDIRQLSAYYLQHYNNKYKRQLTLSNKDKSALERYAWPGNARELAHTIERSVILAENGQFDVASLVTHTSVGDSHMAFEVTASETFNLELVEQRTVRKALKHYHGNVSHAAKALGLSRGAMYRRLEKYGL